MAEADTPYEARLENQLEQQVDMSHLQQDLMHSEGSVVEETQYGEDLHQPFDGMAYEYETETAQATQRSHDSQIVNETQFSQDIAFVEQSQYDQETQYIDETQFQQQFHVTQETEQPVVQKAKKKRKTLSKKKDSISHTGQDRTATPESQLQQEMQAASMPPPPFLGLRDRSNRLSIGHYPLQPLLYLRNQSRQPTPARNFEGSPRSTAINEFRNQPPAIPTKKHHGKDNSSDEMTAEDAMLHAQRTWKKQEKKMKTQHKEQVDALQTEAGEERRGKQAAEAQVQSLQQEVERLHELVEKQKKKIGGFETKAGKFKTFVDGLGKDFDLLKSDANAHQSKHNKLLSEATEQYQEQRGVLQKLSSDAEEAARLRDKALKMCQEVKTELSTAAVQQSELQVKLQSSAQRLGEETDLRQRLQTQLQTRSNTDDSEAIRRELKTLKSNNDAILDKLYEIHSICEESNDTQEVVDMLQKTAAAIQSLNAQSIATPEDVFALKNALLESLSTSLSACSGVTEDYQQQVKACIEENFVGLKADLSKHDKLAAENAAHVAEIARLRQELISVRDGQNELREQHEAPQAALENAEAQVAALEIQLNELRAHPAVPTVDETAHKRELEKAYEDGRKAATDNVNELREAEQAELDNERRAFEAEKAKLQTAAKQSSQGQMDAEALRAQVNALSRTIAEHESGMETLGTSCNAEIEKAEDTAKKQVEALQEQLREAKEESQKLIASQQEFSEGIERTWKTEQAKHDVALATANAKIAELEQQLASRVTMTKDATPTVSSPAAQPTRPRKVVNRAARAIVEDNAIPAPKVIRPISSQSQLRDCVQETQQDVPSFATFNAASRAENAFQIYEDPQEHVFANTQTAHEYLEDTLTSNKDKYTFQRTMPPPNSSSKLVRTGSDVSAHSRGSQGRDASLKKIDRSKTAPFKTPAPTRIQIDNGVTILSSSPGFVASSQPAHSQNVYLGESAKEDRLASQHSRQEDTENMPPPKRRAEPKIVHGYEEERRKRMKPSGAATTVHSTQEVVQTYAQPTGAGTTALERAQLMSDLSIPRSNKPRGTVQPSRMQRFSNQPLHSGASSKLLSKNDQMSARFRQELAMGGRR